MFKELCLTTWQAKAEVGLQGKKGFLEAVALDRGGWIGWFIQRSPLTFFGYNLNMFKKETSAENSGQPEESKAERTRRSIYQAAMTLFREKGFDKTTMRDISKAAGLSLGASYYYFPSKESIVSAYYQYIQEQQHMYVMANVHQGQNLLERLKIIFHHSIDLVENDCEFMGAVFRFTGDPQHPLSLLGEQTRSLQIGAAQTILLAFEDEKLSAELVELLPTALWGLHMGMLLYLLYDTSEGKTRTRNLIDQSLALVVQLLGLVRQPLLKPAITPVLRQVSSILDQAKVKLVLP